MSETPEQMHNRLIAVMASARFEPLPQPYAWQRVDTLLKLPPGALASVRDSSTWYALAPVSPEAAGAYRILVFHFAEGTNASGFVAWLAGLMKTEVGTGAMVVCGFDARATPGAVANVAGSVRLLGLSLGLWRGRDCPRRARARTK